MNDELYRLARLRAAEQGSNVSALVRAFLEQLTGGDTAFDRKERQQEELLDRIHAAGKQGDAVR